MTHDLEYLDCGLFTAFFPVTSEGEKAWAQLADDTDGTGKVLTIHAKSIIMHLRRAGYSVKKIKTIAKQNVNTMYSEFDGLFSE